MNIQPSGKPAVLYSAEDYLDTENLTFDAETGSITGYNGMNTRLTIPESIDGVPVKAIGKRALWEDPLLGYVTLPEGLEYVGEDAFSITDTLKYVEFPSTLKTIDRKVFHLIGDSGWIFRIVWNISEKKRSAIFGRNRPDHS